MATLACVVGGGLAVLAAPGRANPLENWPQWRGPLANGVAPRGNPPVTWSEASNVKWKTKLPGRGTATPIVWEDQVFILTAVPTERQSTPARAETGAPAGRSRGRGGLGSQQPDQAYQFRLLSLDRQNGQVRWQQVAREGVPHEGHHRDHSFASASPWTDGEHVFAYFNSRGLHCYDLAGNRRWQKDLGRMQTRNAFGEGSTPAMHGHIIVVNWDHEGEDFIAALDKRDGRELWRQPREEATTWSTPLIVVHAGTTQAVVNASRRVRSYELTTGRPLWECAGQTENVIPSPVSGHGLVYCTSGFRGSALQAIRLGARGNVTGTEAIAWSHDRNTPYVPSPLLYDDLLYFAARNNALFSCHDATTGQAHYEAERFDLFGVYASPVGAAGRVYLAGRDGKVVVLKHGPKPERLALNELAEKFDASPAVAGQQLFLRGHEHLYCLEQL